MDCGCGTGDISILLSQNGHIVDAIDTAADMLMVAKEKSHNLGLHINYTIQDIRTFKSHNSYSLITCINDGVNYLTNLNDVELFFENCQKHMDKDGFLLFDISTIHKLKNMDNQLFAEESDEFSYFWFNEYNEESNLLTMDLTFFTQIEEDIYKRTTEKHIQRGHSKKEISILLKKCGFELVETFGDISPEKPNDESERIHFLAKKI